MQTDDNRESDDSEDSEGIRRIPNETGSRVDGHETSVTKWALPFGEFVALAIREHIEEDVFSQETLWHFTRLIHGYFEEGTKVDQAFMATDREVKKKLGGWESLGVSQEEAHGYFTSHWGAIRWRLDEDPLDQALTKAAVCPVNTPAKAVKTPKYDRFVSVALWLQATVGDADIFLPVRKLATLLETDQRMISIWRKMAVKDGFLVEVGKHQFGKIKRATRFRFNASLVEAAKAEYARRTS